MDSVRSDERDVQTTMGATWTCHQITSNKRDATQSQHRRKEIKFRNLQDPEYIDAEGRNAAELCKRAYPHEEGSSFHLSLHVEYRFRLATCVAPDTIRKNEKKRERGRKTDRDSDGDGLRGFAPHISPPLGTQQKCCMRDDGIR
jgi:hypothetical protein